MPRFVVLALVTVTTLTKVIITCRTQFFPKDEEIPLSVTAELV